jgi:hypothetical protein
MPALTLSIPHHLSQQEATDRLKQFLGKVKERYGNQVSDLQETWTEHGLNFGFKTYGFNVQGQLAVAPSEVKIDGQLPFAAMMFKGKIEQAIRDELSRLLT